MTEKPQYRMIPAPRQYSFAETIVFVFPSSLEDALWAVPVMCQYLMNRLAQRREPKMIWIVCSLQVLHPLLRSCWKTLEVVAEMPDEARDADFIFEFNPEKAFRLTENVGKHIGEAYGTTIGAIPMVLFPPLALPIEQEDLASVLYVERSDMDKKLPGDVWEHQDEFIDMGLDAGILVRLVTSDTPWDILLTEIARASVVVGVRSSGTLIASVGTKISMELAPEAWAHRNWMAKWENPKSRCIYGDINRIQAPYVWERTQELVRDLSAKARKTWATPSPTPTALQAVAR